MELNLDMIVDKIKKNDIIENFIKELSKALEKMNNKNEVEIKGEKMDNITLTNEEEVELEKKEFNFLQNFFKEELSNLSKGEPYIVTNKYENDSEYHRYKITQYKDYLECKYIVFEKDLPVNVKLRDIVRKIDGKYIYDEQATNYVSNSIEKIKQDIINKRI